MKMNNNTFLGIDMGGTNIRGGIVYKNKLDGIISRRLNSHGSLDEVLQQVFTFIDALTNENVTAIGIGVPGLVNSEEQAVYDVVHIPSWKKIALQKLMQERYKIPVYIENDANCFALGEHYFGKGKGYDSMIGLTIGTGLGSGIIINKKLYAGKNGGAGEFGMIEYLDKCYEYYASGKYFENVYNMQGGNIFNNAKSGDALAIKMYEEMGTHLGNFIKTLLYSLDVELIVIGGSVRYAWQWYQTSIWKQLETFAYQKTLLKLKIEVSELKNAGVLGAAALCYERR
jgi:glucokinase